MGFFLLKKCYKLLNAKLAKFQPSSDLINVGSHLDRRGLKKIKGRGMATILFLWEASMLQSIDHTLSDFLEFLMVVSPYQLSWMSTESKKFHRTLYNGAFSQRMKTWIFLYLIKKNHPIIFISSCQLVFISLRKPP